jgi:NAD(P)-dependent dehydrogenase (short-subunit alcohol dehydrogenase family)
MLTKRLDGKKVLLVGVDGNLGPVWAKALLDEGATVWGVGLRATSDLRLAKLGETSNELILGDLDISQPVSAKDIEECLGVSLSDSRVDGVVMNAGIDSVPGQGKTHLVDYDREEWSRVFDVNVFGIVDVLNSVVGSLASPSSVVMLGSLYGMVAPNPHLMSHFDHGKGQVKHPAYGASKAALVAMARQYGTNLAPRGIRVNTLTLGGVMAGQDAEFVEKYSAMVPQGRMLELEELTGAMLFLLSDDSRAMTGQNVVVDGGFTAW